MNLSAKSTALLPKLGEPQLFYKHFMMCLETPRPSFKLEKMIARLKAIGAEMKLETNVDSVGNVVIRKPAFPGYENSAKLILQCHMDMVCSKTQDSTFDFDNDSIDAKIVDGYLVANGTTLGADDGVGMAAGLAILEEKDLPHGPLEVLFTTDEETNMGGAMGLAKAPFLQGDVLLNLDSEDEHAICVGCAGGFDKDMFLPVELESVNMSDHTICTIRIHGLLGGHSGIDIDKQRANALKLVGRLVQELCVDVQLTKYSGGNARNAIPRDASVEFLVKKDDFKNIQTAVNKTFESIKQEYAVIEAKEINEPNEIPQVGIKVEVEEMTNSTDSITAVTIKSTKAILNLMSIVPVGVERFSPVLKGEVECSVNVGLADLNMETKKFTFHFLARSSSMQQSNLMSSRLNALASATGCEVTDEYGIYPGWEPVIDSSLVQTLISTHKTLFNFEPKVYSVHAGLECGVLQGHYPHFVCASIGPQIYGAHSPDERLKLDTVEPWYNWLKSTVKTLAEEGKK